MLRRLLVTAAALAALGGVALAQTASGPFLFNWIQGTIRDAGTGITAPVDANGLHVSCIAGCAAPAAASGKGKWISAATTNATSVKGSAGTLYTIAAINPTATLCYLKLYDKASAPTVGTDTPVLTFPIPTNSTNGSGFVLAIPPGVTFATGIAFAVTGAAADGDTSAAPAGVVVDLVWN